MCEVIKPENYIVIQGWMITELGLSGRELILYALIFGFSQGDGEGYAGSLKYLTEWSGSTKQNVMSVLKSLVNKGFLTKHEETRGGVKVCRYITNFTTSQKILPPPGEIILPGGQKILPNKYIDTDISPIKELKVEESTINDTVDSKLTEAIENFSKYRKQMRVPLTDYAKKLLLNKLERLAPGDEETQISIINQSIEFGYRGVFPLKEDVRKQPKPESNLPDGLEFR